MIVIAKHAHGKSGLPYWGARPPALRLFDSEAIEGNASWNDYSARRVGHKECPREGKNKGVRPSRPPEAVFADAAF